MSIRKKGFIQESVKHFMYPNEKTVVCNLKVIIPSVATEDTNYYFADFSKTKFKEVYNRGDVLIISTQGVSRCSPYDVYNKKTGENIASARAQLRAFQIAKAIYKKRLSQSAVVFANNEMAIKQLSNAIEHEKNFIEKHKEA